MKLILILPICLSIFFLSETEPKEIYLQRASFEGEEYRGKMLNYYEGELLPWEYCIVNTGNESAPDIICEDSDFWKIDQSASDGSCFLNLVTRGDGSYESIIQRLSDPIPAGQCFKLSVDVSHSSTLESATAGSHKLTKFNKPAALIISGGKYKCASNPILFRSELVRNENWETLTIDMKAVYDIDYLSFYAFYEFEHIPTYGNLLLDNISAISFIECRD